MTLQRQLTFSHWLVTLLSLGLLFPLLLWGYSAFQRTPWAASWLLDESDNLAAELSYLLNNKKLPLEPELAQYIVDSYLPPFDYDNEADENNAFLAEDWLLDVNDNALLEALEDLEAWLEFDPEQEVMTFLLDGKGTMLASSFTELGEVRLEPSHFNAKTQRHSLQRKDNFFFAQSPVYAHDGTLQAWLLIRFPAEAVENVVGDIIGNLLLFAGLLIVIAAIFAGLVGSLLAQRFSRRIAKLQQASHALARGDFAVQLEPEGKDEIAQLSHAFLGMAGQLKHQMDELEQLAASNQQLSLEKESLARAEERHHLARELHDAVKQQIFALHLGMGGLLSKKAYDVAETKDTLQEMTDLSHNVLQEMDNIIRELRPASLEDKGLAQALGDYLEHFAENRHLPCHFSHNTPFDLPIAQEQCLYRVAQEALNNVFKHAKAKNAHIHLHYDVNKVSLSVRDDGEGFDANNIQSTGIQGMLERVAAFQGELTITSNRQGTTLRAWLPVENYLA